MTEIEQKEPAKRATLARTYRQDEEFEDAGTYYAAAAYGWFMKFRVVETVQHQPPYASHHLGYGIQDLTASALCYRLAGEDQRCHQRCKEGYHIIQDLLEHDPVFQTEKMEPERGFFNEVLGDFAMIDGGEYEPHYEYAAKIYQQVPNPINWQAESEFHSAIQTALELADSTGFQLDSDHRERIEHVSLADRIDFKRNHFADIVDQVLADGNWVADVL